MQKLIFTSLIVFFNAFLIAQETQKFSLAEVMNYQITFRVYSPNNDYCSTVSGHYYEGFGRNQIISLYNNDFRGKNLWNKFVSSTTHIPAVSDSGDVALIDGNKYSVYSKYGNLLYSYIPKNGAQIHGMRDYEHPVHIFSPSTEQFYFVIDSVVRGSKKNVPQLLTCINDNGKIAWQYNLGVYFPCHIYVVNDKIVIDNISNEGGTTPYSFKVFNESGKLINEIILPSGSSSLPAIDEENSAMVLYSNKKLFSYNLEINNKKIELSKETVKEFLFSEDPAKISIGLRFIYDHFENSEIADEMFKRILKLTDYKSRKTWFDYSIANKSRYIIEKICIK